MITAGLARMWYGFLGLLALGHDWLLKQQGSFTDNRVSPCGLLTSCMPLGVKLQSRASLIWNFLLDCLTEGKNIMFALLIVIPCEIKRRKNHVSEK